MHQVFFARSAQTDLLEAWLFIADQGIEAADHVMDVIEREAQTLALAAAHGQGSPPVPTTVMATHVFGACATGFHPAIFIAPSVNKPDARDRQRRPKLPRCLPELTPEN